MLATAGGGVQSRSPLIRAPRVSWSNPVNRREQLFATALQLFARYGYKKTTVEDIAGELGLTKGALYLYVKNKQDLYEKTVAWALVEWQQHVRDAVMGETDVRERLRAVALTAFEYLLGNAELQALITADTDFHADLLGKEPFAAIHRDSEMMMANILEEGIAAGAFRQVDVAATAGVLLTLYLGFIQRARQPAQRELLLAQYRTLLDLVCTGLFAPNGEACRR